MTTPAERLFLFERVYNFRDLGGYTADGGRTVRWRRLFRSAELHRMTPEEAARARELGIRTVIDFRTEPECDHPNGLGPFCEPPVVRYHLPMGDPRSKYRAKASGEWHPRYTEVLQQYGPGFAQAVTLLSQDEVYPALFHCVTGKDRTGVLAALVLGAVGVDDETVLEDYAISQEQMQRLIDSLRTRGIIRPDEPPNPALGVSVPAMEDALEWLRREHGGTQGYLLANGVDEQAIERLMDLLLEERPMAPEDPTAVAGDAAPEGASR